MNQVEGSSCKRSGFRAIYTIYSRLVKFFGGDQRIARIVIDCYAEFHYFHIKPIVEHFAADSSFEVIVLTWPKPGIELPVGAKFVERESLKWQAWRPFDLFIASDFTKVPWWIVETKIAFFLHGVGPKVTYFTSPRLLSYDIIFTPSPFVEEMQKPVARSDAEFLPAGLPALDSIVEKAAARVSRSKARPLMLYAPSWSSDCEQISADIDIIDAIVGQDLCDCIIRPHPNLMDEKKGVPGLKQALMEAPLRNPRVHLHTGSGTSVYDVIADADILMSDISSVLYEFLSLDRPIILNIKSTVAEFYGAEEIIAQTRQACTEISQNRDLLSALEECIREPGKRSDERMRIRDRMLYNCGNATDVMVDQIYTIVGKK